MTAQKKILYVNRKPPHGTVYAQESLDVALIGAAFDQNVSLAFFDDGVYQLLAGQDTNETGLKNFAATYRALGDYDIHSIYVESESMKKRGLTIDDLLEITYIDEDDNDSKKPCIQLIDSEELRDIINEQDIVLSF